MVTTEGDTKVSNRRNLYVRNEDLEVWEKAERLADDLSPLVSRLLRSWVEQREVAMDRIVVPVMEPTSQAVIRKGFRGRMLVEGFKTQLTGSSLYGGGRGCSAAVGTNGGLALWIDPTPSTCFRTYASFDEAMKDVETPFGPGPNGVAWPRDFLSAVSTALGEAYVEEIDL